MKTLAAVFAACALAAAPQVFAQPEDQPATAVPPTSAGQFTTGQLDAVIAGSWRSPANKARDVYRHPKETLTFFGLRPDMKVIEIAPGGGWYTEILAPLLHDNGHYIAAVIGQGEGKEMSSLKARVANDPAHFGNAQVESIDEKAPKLGAPGSADMVLTFRNVHNWTDDGTAPAMFKAFFDVLAPGGVLGVEDHRAADGADPAKLKDTGYLPTAVVVKLATDAGFRLAGSSEVNANPKDTKDYPKGVWTLPPTYALKDQDRAKYQAIGESDRMTLRFVKPR